MQNQVTVTLFLPWISDFPKTERETLYKQVAGIAHDSKHASHSEANRLLSALTVKRETYSYEEDSANLRFKSYTELSKLLPNQELQVRVTKVGPHIQSGTKSDVTYYNAIQADYVSGQMISQTIGHVDAITDNDVVDSVTLSGSSVCQTLAMLKTVAVSEAAKHDRTKINVPTVPSYQTDHGFAL